MTITDKSRDDIVVCSLCKLRFLKEDMGMNRLKELYKCCPKCREHSRHARLKRLNKLVCEIKGDQQHEDIQETTNSETQNHEPHYRIIWNMSKQVLP